MTNQAIEYIREKVILAAHPECKTYDEALEKELGFGCEVEIGTKKYIYIKLCHDSHFLVFGDNKRQIYIDRFHDKFKIIGQPLTLARVLNAFKEDQQAIDSKGYIYDVLASGDGDYIDCENVNIGLKSIKKGKWRFLNKDGSSALLDQQSPETILAIAKLSGYDK